MKKLLTILCWLIGITLSAATYYVSTTGDNGNPGTIGSPWLTFQYALTQTAAGDTVYFRGGIYSLTSYSSGLSFSGSASGTAINPICYFAYPADYAAGNEPIFDCSSQTAGNFPKGIYVTGAEYVHLKGLTVKNVINTNPGGTGMGWYIHSSNVTLENCVAKNIKGMGYQVDRNNIYFLNCDADSCNDGMSAGDGWQVASPSLYYTVRFKGCRAINCEDDGWDNYWDDGVVEYDSCWAIQNGYNPNGTPYTTGAGNGFKLGKNYGSASGGTQRLLTNCIAADNRGVGLTENNAACVQQQMHIYNNLFYHNTYGCMNFATSNNTYHAYYQNNIAYGNTTANVQWYSSSKAVAPYQTNNSWQAATGVTVSSADFVTLSTTLLYGTRQADGSLPVITFGTLVESSDLIDAGLDVGLAFNGDAPDLGWSEYGFAEEPAAPQVNTADPVITSPSSVTVGGNYITDGGSAILTKGVYWATHSNPTVADNVIACGSGSADYTTPITGLETGETYYVKAYVSNAVGFGYGAVESFEMPETPPVVIGGPVGVGGKLVRHLGKIIVVP